MKITKTMKKLSLLFIIICLGLASCQNKYPELEDGIYAEFNTNKGVFVAKLNHKETPLTVSNFVDLAEGKNDMVDSTYKGKPFYNGLKFHRVIKDFMIQGGDPMGTGAGSPGYTFPDEFADSLTHKGKGILSMANSGPSTNGSQFFITLKETPWLDGKHTVFGEIVIGQEIVDSIGIVETTQPGDKPVVEVVINELNIIRKGNVSLDSFENAMAIVDKKIQEEQAEMLKIASESAEKLAAQKEQAEELPSGLKILYTEKAEGVKPAEGSKITMNYAGYLQNGTLFDSNMEEVAKRYMVYDHRRADAGGYNPAESDYSKDARLIPGFREGLLLLSVGDKATIFIPSHLAYGERGIPNVIPPNSDLIFELELVEIVE